MARDFASTVRPHLERHLKSGEALQGVIAATHQRFFGASLYAIGVTEGRLILQEIDRKLQPRGEPLSITPETLAAADVDDAGSGFWTVPSAILDMTAITLTLRTTGGVKMKMMMMKGGGGFFGKLGGGEDQRGGILALAAWMQRRDVT